MEKTGKGKTGMYVNPEIVDELPPPTPPRTPRKPHYKVVAASGRALAVAKASPKWSRLARYNKQQDAMRAAGKLRQSKVWGGIGKLETAYRMTDGGQWVVYARYELPLKINAHDLDRNAERLRDEFVATLYGEEINGDEVNVITGVSLQGPDSDDGLESEDQTN